MMTRLEAEAETILIQMLEWFNQRTPGEFNPRPDDLCKEAMGWLSQVKILRAMGKL